MQTLKAGVLYFVLVFGVGFVLGPIRILWDVMLGVYLIMPLLMVRRSKVEYNCPPSG